MGGWTLAAAVLSAWRAARRVHRCERASGFCQHPRIGDARLSVQCTVMSPILRRARNRIAVPRPT